MVTNKSPFNKIKFLKMKFPALKKLYLYTYISCITMGLSGLYLPSPTSADIYRYVDKGGTIHFTNIPTTHRYQLFKRQKSGIRYSSPTRYDRLIREISQKHRINPALVKAVIKAESDFNPYAVSKKGARGLMQLMPITLKELKVYDPFHPRDNINGGVRFLKRLLKRFNNDLPLTLAAYNAGAKIVEKYEDIPPYQETQHYVRKVLNYFDHYRQEL